MSEKLIGAIFTTICMVAVGVMIVLMTIGASNAWLAAFIGGIIAVAFLMIASAAKKGKNDKK